MKASIGNSTTVDLSVECAGMLEKLMLAQAQECVFENTIAKGSTPGVCAKISRQVNPNLFANCLFVFVIVPHGLFCFAANCFDATVRLDCIMRKHWPRLMLRL